MSPKCATWFGWRTRSPTHPLRSEVLVDFLIDFLRVPSMTIRDVIDICLVAYITYRFLLLIRGTRGAQMTFGIVVLLLFYGVTRYYRLTAVQWLLTNLLTYIVFGIIVL